MVWRPWTLFFSLNIHLSTSETEVGGGLKIKQTFDQNHWCKKYLIVK